MRNILTRSIDVDFVLGLLLGLPFAYPDAPYYLLAFLAFIIALFRIRLTSLNHKIYFSATILCIILSIGVNFLSPYPEYIILSVLVSSTLFFPFFLFGFGLKDIDSFLRGYCVSMTCLSIAMLVMFAIIKPYSQGIAVMFVSSKLRMWGYDYFPDFPNLLAIGLMTSFLINTLYHSRPSWALVNLLALFTTTSRSGFLALFVFGFYVLLNWKLYKFYAILVLLSVLVAVGGYIFYSVMIPDNVLESRLLKTSDRAYLFSTLIEYFYNNPITGIGSLRPDFLNRWYVSYHNTFLKMLIRFGIITFIVYCYLIFPKTFLKRLTHPANAVLLYYLIVSQFQDSLGHPHFIFLYSTFLVYAAREINKEKKNSGSRIVVPQKQKSGEIIT